MQIWRTAGLPDAETAMWSGRRTGTTGQESLNGPDGQVSSRQLPQGGAFEVEGVGQEQSHKASCFHDQRLVMWTCPRRFRFVYYRFRDQSMYSNTFITFSTP